MDMLGSPAILCNIGEATVAWRRTIGRTVLSIEAARAYIRKTRHEESHPVPVPAMSQISQSVERDQSVCVLSSVVIDVSWY
jgi:hypothetical protein